MLDPENSRVEIQTLLDKQVEWLLIKSSGKTFALRNGEIEISFEYKKLLLGFLSASGFQTWRITDCKIKNNKITLRLSRNFGKETEKITLVPRVSAGELNSNLELARLKKANQIAALIKETVYGANLVRVDLNEENGRFARIIFEDLQSRQIAVLADITGTPGPEILLSTAILWLAGLERRKKNPIETIWILCERKIARKLQKLHALLQGNWKRKIFIKEISYEAKEPEKANLVEIQSLEIPQLWKTKAKEVKLNSYQISETEQKIINLCPEKIDAVFTGNGTTLRFSGLPFARVRKVFEREKTWFGIENNRQILTENNWPDLLDLVGNVDAFRRADSPNKRHALYTLAPEAWLEAILRRNIKLLDANLILSPLYHQFRAERDKIDLLALRKDGRVVVIEIKVAPDRELIFQAADYWRKIELQRRKGNLQKTRLFGDLEISDAPAIVYLVAPTLCFHRHFDFMAKTISPDIDIYRFNVNENWRENLKILDRKRVTKPGKSVY